MRLDRGVEPSDVWGRFLGRLCPPEPLTQFVGDLVASKREQFRLSQFVTVRDWNDPKKS